RRARPRQGGDDERLSLKKTCAAFRMAPEFERPVEKPRERNLYPVGFRHIKERHSRKTPLQRQCLRAREHRVEEERAGRAFAREIGEFPRAYVDDRAAHFNEGWFLSRKALRKILVGKVWARAG